MNKEEIKNEFINCIEGSHTLNLAISVLEDREDLQQRIDNIIEFFIHNQDLLDNRNFIDNGVGDIFVRILRMAKGDKNDRK